MKTSGPKAGELYDRATKALANARARLLRLCGAQDYDFPSHKVRYCGTERRKVSGSTLTYDGRVYEIQNTLQAKPGDDQGDHSLVCYRVAQSESRQMELLVFIGP